MKLEKGMLFPQEIACDGTIMDFVDHEFLFVIRDETWSDFELTALQRNTLHLEFVYKYDICIFLITLDDAIDTSDFIFNVHDNDYDEGLFLNDGHNVYNATLCLIDKDNVIQGKRTVTLAKEISSIIAQTIRKQQETPYREDAFLCNLEGLQQAYEPFEMQPLAIAAQKF